jgi:hypothetical protein
MGLLGSENNLKSQYLKRKLTDVCPDYPLMMH